MLQHTPRVFSTEDSVIIDCTACDWTSRKRLSKEFAWMMWKIHFEAMNPPKEPEKSMEHIPHVLVSFDDKGQEHLKLDCRGCDYTTGERESKKATWALFREHAMRNMSKRAKPPVPPPMDIPMFEDA